jgi:hypothetical protein
MRARRRRGMLFGGLWGGGRRRLARRRGGRGRCRRGSRGGWRHRRCRSSWGRWRCLLRPDGHRHRQAGDHRDADRKTHHAGVLHVSWLKESDNSGHGHAICGGVFDFLNAPATWTLLVSRSGACTPPGARPAPGIPPRRRSVVRLGQHSGVPSAAPRAAANTGFCRSASTEARTALEVQCTRTPPSSPLFC